MALKTKLIHLLARLYRVVPFYPGIILFFIDDINNQKYRHIRSRMLRADAQRLSRLMARLNFGQKILVDGKDGASVESDGIFLDCRVTNKYFKVPGTRSSGNAGFEKDRFLKKQRIEPLHIIDIGANFGELSLFFCRQYPQCRILAIEASPDNFTILKNNINRQFFDTSTIVAVNLAVLDKKGTISLTGGVGQSNTVIIDDRNETYQQDREKLIDVQADTLDSITKKHNFSEIDFVKINIEGAEPLLTSDLLKLQPKVMHIEYSSQNTFENNLQMIVALSEEYLCYTNDYEELPSRNRVEEFMKEQWGTIHQFSDGKTFHRGTGIWFLRKDKAGG